MTRHLLAFAGLAASAAFFVSAAHAAPTGFFFPGGAREDSVMHAPGSTLDGLSVTQWGMAIDANATAAAQAQTTASAAIPQGQIGVADGVAGLDGNARVASPVWSPSLTSSPQTLGGLQPLVNAGRFPVASSLASDTDPFQSPDAFYIGGLPTQGWAADGTATNQTSRPGSLVVAGQPWGPFNGATLESLVMAAGVDAQNGVCAADWRAGAGHYCGADGVAQYIGVTNVAAMIVGNVSSFTAGSVVLKTALTAEQMSRLRVGMYISTNIVNDTTVPTAATDSWGNTKLAHLNYYLSIISGWSADGTTIYVSGWDIPWGGSHAGGQIPQQITGDAIDVWNSNYGAPVVFIGNPDNGSAHNEYLDYKGYNAGDVSGVFGLAADMVAGSSTITVNGTPQTVAGYTTNITGAGIAANTTVTAMSTTNGVTTITLSTPTVSAEDASKTSVTVFSSGITGGSTLAHMLTGDEIDLRYWATHPNEVHLDGITIGVDSDSGSPLGRTALTPDSYLVSLSGDIHNLLVLDGPDDGNIITGHSFYLHGHQGVSTVNGNNRPVQTLFGFTGEVDGDSAYNLMGWEKKDLPDTNGINGASFHLGIVDNGYANTLDPSQNGAAEIVWNHNGTNVGGISLCGASGCGLDVRADGLMTTTQQINAQNTIAMTAGNQLQFIPSDNNGYSYWYAPPSVGGLTLSAKTYQGGDASITGYNGTFTGAVTSTGSITSKADIDGANGGFSGNVTAKGTVTGQNITALNGGIVQFYPTATGVPGPYLQAIGSGPATLAAISNAGGLAYFQAAQYHENLYTPSSSTASCTAGDFVDDANYHYVCVADNSWKRVALSTF
ncbi:hypothetical protein [Gluconobacter oxydans]|uniref:hypothetical protein n=1 Tax=Gluconobacter oxydans TaxID=442 RepID=UPI0039EC7691